MTSGITRRESGAGLVRTFARMNTDMLSELDSLDASMVSATRLTIARPVRFGDDPPTDLANIVVLRELTSRAVRLDWHMLGKPLVPLRELVHLIPPVDGLDRSGRDIAARWRSRYAYGTFYYRVGPGYLLIKDIRPGGEHARFVISGQSAQDFLRWAGDLSVTPASTLASDEARRAMRAAGLSASIDGHLVVLPFRMRRWPVPFSAV
jgi:hypothetical protein